MSYLVDNPEDRISRDEAQIRDVIVFILCDNAIKVLVECTHLTSNHFCHKKAGEFPVWSRVNPY